MSLKSLIPAALALAGALFATVLPAAAAHEVNTVPGLTAAGAPLALHGYDPVAYFTSGRPEHGKAEYTAKHDGAAYYFASETNREAFQANPEKYVPQYGGYCAYGVSVAKKFDGDPRFWKIVGGKLYLNLNAEIAQAFEADIKGAIKKADGHWPDIKSKPPAAL